LGGGGGGGGVSCDAATMTDFELVTSREL